MRAKSRSDQLLTQPVGDELVIYDERSHAAHRLNATAAQVWRLADGERSVQDIAAELRETLGAAVASPESEELVHLALTELDRAELLVQRLSALAEPMTRRQMLVVAAALVPVVASIVAPTPAMAATVRVTASYRHIEPGRSVICVDTRLTTFGIGQNSAVTLTVTGPGTNVSRTINTNNPTGMDQEPVEISSFGMYTVSVSFGTNTDSTTVNVTEAQGTCPAEFVDTLNR